MRYPSSQRAAMGMGMGKGGRIKIIPKGITVRKGVLLKGEEKLLYRNNYSNRDLEEERRMVEGG